ncbi:MAG: FAD-binding oxidoreductase, partial [Pseudomonadota bacterium]
TLHPPSADFLDALRERLGPQGVREAGDSAPYLSEPRDLWQGEAALILRPGSAAEVAALLKTCAEARVAVIPHAGGTGLVGGQVRPEGPTGVLLSVERLNRVRRVAPEDDAMIVEAGVILAEAQRQAEAVDRLFPLSIAAEGSARIGGVLGTNAGGVQVLRYGMARDLVLGVEAALPDGSIHRGLKLLRKDNTGYDLRHLLIGSEGTLGVITAAALRLFPRPRETATAFVAVAGPSAALDLLHGLRAALGETISAFELIKDAGVGFALAHVPGVRAPFTPMPGWSVLVEAGGPEGMGERLEAGLAEAFDRGEAQDAVIAASEAQRQEMWRLRESLPEANRKVGSIASHDVSAPMSRVAAFIDEAETTLARIAPELRTNCFGHLGDGNLHYNVFPPEGRRREEFANMKGEITRVVHDLIDAHGGSISAEHGIGRLKREDFARYGDPAKIAAMRAIKAALDPAGIMNPGAVLP